MTADIESLVERLIKYRQKSDVGCWIWQGARHASGYGAIRFRQKTLRVHRVMAWLVLGLAIEDSGNENCVAHKCNNPRCFNPLHLRITSQSSNLSDMSKKTHCRNGHEMTPENCRYGRYRRYCRICERIGRKRV